MSRSIFGWSYPPGVSRLPWDEEHPCAICGKSADDCICQECPTCSSVGDPKCYKEHGLIMTKEQMIARVEMRIAQHQQLIDEDKLFLELMQSGTVDYDLQNETDMMLKQEGYAPHPAGAVD